MELEFKEVTHEHRKIHLMKKFYDAYSGQLSEFNNKLRKYLTSDNSKYIAIVNNDIIFGFARIEDHSNKLFKCFQ